MNDFLPEGYEVPATKGNYMRFQDGVNKFRILTSPVIGYEYWNEDNKGDRKPIRKHMNENLVLADIQEPDKVKHFWAMVVWNYDEKRIQILEITQKTIQRTLRGLAKDEDWGSPKDYDIKIERSGKELLTKYEVTPSPKKPLTKEISEAFEKMPVNLEALFSGNDPFKSELTETLIRKM